MAKEDVKVQDGVAEVDSVEDLIPTDEELSALFDAAENDSEPKVTEEPRVEETARVEAEPTSGTEDEDGLDDDLEDQRDRSRLGRRLKRLEGTIETLVSSLESERQQRQIAEYMRSQQPKQTRDFDQDEPSRNDDIVTTETDVERVVDKRERRKVEEAERYQNGFVAQLNAFKGNNPKLHQKIVEELITNFNRKITGNPQVDARLNYAEAKAALATKLLASQSQKAKPNVAGGTQSATGVSASSTAQKSGKGDIWSRLDKEAADYAKSLKMTEEEVEEALAGDLPMNLRPKGRIG
jgi:hypothetical protein